MVLIIIIIIIVIIIIIIIIISPGTSFSGRLIKLKQHKNIRPLTPGCY